MTITPFRFALNTLSLVLACAAGVASQGPVAAQDLFPDKGLEAAVRQEVFAKRYNAEPLTKDDVKNISQVKGKGKGIKSLAGIENCVAVQEVDLENNEVTDLTPLAGLKQIQLLVLTRNKIESIAPLAELERIQYLELSGNAVSDLAPLAKMTNMRSLYLSNNKITKIDTIKGLTKVYSLYLDGNKIEDFSPISQLPWLDRLDVRGCGIEKLDFLKALDDLKYLMLAENKISDLTVLIEMAKADSRKQFAPFWQIYLYDNPLSDKAKGEQVAELKGMGGRVFTEKPAPKK